MGLYDTIFFIDPLRPISLVLGASEFRLMSLSICLWVFETCLSVRKVWFKLSDGVGDGRLVNDVAGENEWPGSAVVQDAPFLIAAQYSLEQQP